MKYSTIRGVDLFEPAKWGSHRGPHERYHHETLGSLLYRSWGPRSDTHFCQPKLYQKLILYTKKYHIKMEGSTHIINTGWPLKYIRKMITDISTIHYQRRYRSNYFFGGYFSGHPGLILVNPRINEARILRFNLIVTK